MTKKRVVLHKQVYVPTGFGAGQMNTTVCGRVNNYEDEKNNGANVAIGNEEVTCKFCLRILELQKQREKDPNNNLNPDADFSVFCGHI